MFNIYKLIKMFSNFVIVLLVVLVLFYLTGFMNNNEGFRGVDSNIYESIGVVPSKMLYLTPPNPSEPNIDYQNYLDTVSGYNSGSRGYSNPVYAADIAAGLDTN